MQFAKAALQSAAFFLALTLAADEVADSRRFYQDALAARKEKDTAAFVKNMRAASDLRPQHPTLLYQLAVALESNGQRQEAVRVLERVAAMGFVYPAEKDFPDPHFASVARQFASNAKPIGAARRELVIDRIALIPEGMAWDGKRLFVSSVRTKTIFVGDQVFATAPWGVFGMAADAKRGVLWATTTALPQVEGFKAEDKGKAALLKIGLRNGRVLETLVVAEGEHHFGDVAVTADGEVFVSDSATPVIYRVVRGAGVPPATAGHPARQQSASGETPAAGERDAHPPSALEPFVRGPFVSLQGIAPVGNILYVADYSKGLFAIDRRTRDVHALGVPPTASLLGVDGLYAVDERTLVGTQNGTNPNRIIRIRLAPGGLAVARVETLLASSPLMGDPTLGVVAGNRFFFNANAQWERFSDDGKISDPATLSEAVVLSIPLR